MRTHRNSIDGQNFEVLGNARLSFLLISTTKREPKNLLTKQTADRYIPTTYPGKGDSKRNGHQNCLWYFFFKVISAKFRAFDSVKNEHFSLGSPKGRGNM